MNKAILTAATFAALAAGGATTQAGVSVTYANVVHTVLTLPANPLGGTPPIGGPVTVLNSNNPGNSFDTFDSTYKVGFKSDIGPTSGLLRASAWGEHESDGTKLSASTSGTVDFTVSGGTFSIAAAPGPYGTGVGSMQIKNLSTSESWVLSYYTIGDAHVSGNFPAVAPSGSYEVTWSINPYLNLAYGGSSSLQANLTFTPEPTLLMSLAAAAPLVVRRRR